MSLSEQVRQKLIATFLAEQREHLQQITQGLLTLEKGVDSAAKAALLADIFREAHSLKGSARAVNMTIIESLGHALEELLLKAKEGGLTFSPALFDLLYQALDGIEVMLQQVETGNTTTPAQILVLLSELETAVKTPPTADPLPPPPAAVADTPPNGRTSAQTAPAAKAGSGEESIRVPLAKIDALMEQFSDLLAAKIRAEQRLAEIREMQTFATQWQKEWVNLRFDYEQVARQFNRQQQPVREWKPLLNFMAKNQEQIRRFNQHSNTLYREFSNDVMRLSLAIDELEEDIKRVRMLPLSTITTTFSRMVRDLAREQDKQVTLIIEGADTELDKRLLEQIKDPLIHILRNAVDHGVEPPLIRQAAAKPAAATITLTAGQQGNHIMITVVDDGAGLDLPALRETAVARGFLTAPKAAALEDNEVANLIFTTGLSTSEIITDISGRGVGLDVVRKNVEALHGTLAVDFRPGEGTAFILNLPLTLTSSRGLLVRTGNQKFALPLLPVERMVHIQKQDIYMVQGRETITDQEKPISLAWLSDLLELPVPPEHPAQLVVVILNVAEKRLGLVVDQLLGEQEIVIKNMGRQLLKVGGFMGATQLGSGEVVLVLQAADLLKLAQQKGPTAGATPPKKSRSRTVRKKTVLVVDDSITTRTLEKNILEANGYQVKIATDGEEALTMLLSDNGLPDLIVTDVNMPNLDGFHLTQRLKQDTRFQEIPVILVTSLDSPADKARGIEVGADAYIVKSRFDQSNLLETIEQLTI